MYVAIDLDKPRRLRFDLFAIKDLETSLGGKPLGEILNDLSRMSLTVLCLSLLHGLKHEDATLNVNLVSRILKTYLETGGTLDTVYEKVKDALEQSGLFRTKEDVVAEGNGTPEPAAAG
jgi:hypothetical protein